METENLLEKIIDQLKNCPIHESKDDTFMYCDLDYKMIVYSIENMRLFEQKRITFPTLGGDQRKVSYKRTIAKFKLEDGDLKVLESKSDIELMEILNELRECQVNNHVL